MLKLHCDHQPSLREAAHELGIPEDALDGSFGVVLIDPDNGLYAVRVADDEAAGLEGLPASAGPFADPKIAPFHKRAP